MLYSISHLCSQLNLLPSSQKHSMKETDQWPKVGASNQDS